MKTWIRNAILVNEGQSTRGSVLIEDDRIACIRKDGEGGDCLTAERTIDAEGCYLLPGVIDDHVHFREPGLTRKADIESESRAAAAGGVTSYMDMPNVLPQTTELQLLEEKFALGAGRSRVNYSFFFGATNTNTDVLERLDRQKVCGVKLFMGSSTGNMLVDKDEALYRIFERSPLPIMTHCEDSALIAAATASCRERYGEDPDMIHHPEIRSAEACYRSSSLAVRLAKETGARLHVAHVTTARELELFSPTPLCPPGSDRPTKRITAEACIPHLYFTDADYARLGARIKCNPAVKTASDRDALRLALTDGRIDVVATDHAPHLPEEKQGGCLKALSGMPMIQFSLVSMLGLAEKGILPIERVAALMCHAPALLFDIEDRGFLREGYYADLVLVRRTSPWILKPGQILSKCGWSPMEGMAFQWQVVQTYCNGHLVYDNGRIDDNYRGRPLTFCR